MKIINYYKYYFKPSFKHYSIAQKWSYICMDSVFALDKGFKKTYNKYKV